jgi:hypothetical protein
MLWFHRGSGQGVAGPDWGYLGRPRALCDEISTVG